MVSRRTDGGLFDFDALGTRLMLGDRRREEPDSAAEGGSLKRDGDGSVARADGESWMLSDDDLLCLVCDAPDDG